MISFLILMIQKYEMQKGAFYNTEPQRMLANNSAVYAQNHRTLSL